MTNKIILADCDGVLLNWNTAFSFWMQKQGFTLHHDNEYDIGKRYEIPSSRGGELVAQFNASPEVAHLPPFRDAVSGVRKLHLEHGFNFVVVSALSEKPEAKAYRTQNLTAVFGEGVFDDVICLPIGADKRPALRKWEESGLWWLEDKPENAVHGLEVGLKPILIRATYNDFSKYPKMPYADTWEDIVRIITL